MSLFKGREQLISALLGWRWLVSACLCLGTKNFGAALEAFSKASSFCWSVSWNSKLVRKWRGHAMGDLGFEAGRLHVRLASPQPLIDSLAARVGRIMQFVPHADTWDIMNAGDRYGCFGPHPSHVSLLPLIAMSCSPRMAGSLWILMTRWYCTWPHWEEMRPHFLKRDTRDMAIQCHWIHKSHQVVIFSVLKAPKTGSELSVCLCTVHCLFDVCFDGLSRGSCREISSPT